MTNRRADTKTRRRSWLVLRAAVFGLACTLASSALAQTVRTGDVIDSIPVIAKLDANDLAVGRTHLFWFRATDNSIGQAWYAPVIVVRGAQPGPRLLLTAGVHGDEVNGIAVIQQLTAEIDPAALRGAVIAIPGLNSPGLLRHTREFLPSDESAGANLNRLMPGKTDQGAASLYAYRLWRDLLSPNADTAIDLHTQSRGTAYGMFAFAATPRALQIAQLIAPDIIKLDAGEQGTIELEMLNGGVPAITLELGRPEEFDSAMIARAVDGLRRVMADMGMISPRGLPKAAVKPFTGDKVAEVAAGRGGYARILTSLGADVTKGQKVAVIADPFGRVLETLTAPQSGRVNALATDPLRDPGDMLVRIIFMSPH